MLSLHISDGIPEQGDVGFIVKVRCALKSDQGKEECPPVKPSPAIFHWIIVIGCWVSHKTLNPTYDFININ